MLACGSADIAGPTGAGGIPVVSAEEWVYEARTQEKLREAEV